MEKFDLFNPAGFRLDNLQLPFSRVFCGLLAISFVDNQLP